MAWRTERINSDPSHSNRTQKHVQRNVRRGARPHDRIHLSFTYRAALGAATPSTENSDPKQRRRRRRRRCSRVRRPRFPHLAPKPHPSRHGSETISPYPVHCQKDVRKGVRRRDRGQRPTATENPKTKQRRRRRRRRCSRVRRPRFPHLAPKPHPSRHGSETISPYPVHCQKDVRKGVRRRDRGQRPTATKDPKTKQRRRRQSRH